MQAQQVQGDAVSLARGGKLGAGVGKDLEVPDPPGIKTLSAADFSYDRTQLPRYPEAVQKVASALSYPSDKSIEAATGSGSTILTSSSFEAVVDWYKKSLPPGWQATTVGDFGQLGRSAQQLTPDNIMKMLSGDKDAISRAAPSAAGDVIRLSLLKPPAGSKDSRGVMIVQKGDSPVQILMQINFTR